MQQVDFGQQPIFDDRQSIDELSDLCASLKEQLAAKELNEYEQEVRLRDLRQQLKELSDVEGKLILANRNARVLEEENNALLMKLKSGETADTSGTSFRAEAVKLIEENSSLRSEVHELRGLLNKAQQRESHLDQRCKNINEQQEKNDLQVSLLKKRNAELEEQLHEVQHQWLLAKETWENERSRNLQDYEELLASVKRFDGTAQQRENWDVKTRGSNQHLQQALLKEDIAELEEKLQLAEERYRAKEREWREMEAALRVEISTLQGNNIGTGGDVYRAIQHQLDSFKHEVTVFREERKPGRMKNKLRLGDPSVDDVDDKVSEIDDSDASRESRIQSLEVLNGNISRKNELLMRENEELHKEIEHLHLRNSRAEEEYNDLEVRVKELEIALVSTEKELSLQKGYNINREKDSRCYDVHEMKAVLDENEQLRDSLLEYTRQISSLKAANEEQLAASESSRSEYQAEIAKLLLQNESLQQRLLLRNSRNNSAGELAHDSNDLGNGENEQRPRTRGVSEATVIDKFLKDKLDSTEDFMRSLETAWSEEDEAKRKMRRMSLQDFYKETEQRQNSLQLLQSEKNRLSNEIVDLRHANKSKENRIHELQESLSVLKRHLTNDGLGIVQGEPMRGSGIESRMRRLEEALAQKEQSEVAEKRDKKLQELNDQLFALREANDGLWKQLVSIKDERQEGQRHQSRRNSRSTRRSARRRSMEQLAYPPASPHLADKKKNAVAAGAHLAVTIVELRDLMKNGRPIIEPGYVVIKVKSVKEKYKTSVKELSSAIRFNETFYFYLAQPDEDVITLHVFYKSKGNSREHHVGDAAFTMATLHRGVPRQRVAIVAQNPGTRDARRAAEVEVTLQSDDFGMLSTPTLAQIEEDNIRFKELQKRVEMNSPESLHCVDVLMAMNTH
ncbi:C2 domain containing protein [Trypanosoma equiperdum]|uniref:C2 domain-containing protein n=2 Tax=Trypanozoon TaxID=39700 RepID=Q583I5_TRYB2|nr:hypothetical protein, conserved [Trypanosoma brucei brucei TREU927]AAX79764.1 hypothetical protein, conserved [Trypanosoma brucei]AAZ10799.1 hypothetical protein, conserved [Trypanosoma brucei brucei TREU927]SCU69099.1 C2 domain containing protein [Trypanosoma equiperdum]